MMGHVTHKVMCLKRHVTCVDARRPTRCRGRPQRLTHGSRHVGTPLLWRLAARPKIRTLACLFAVTIAENLPPLDCSPSVILPVIICQFQALINSKRSIERVEEVAFSPLKGNVHFIVVLSRDSQVGYQATICRFSLVIDITGIYNARED